ncbi:RagB/SusD family nutrient uptake outer membrane protein [Parabacteroides sp. OttesenSCG-928-J18]|nr:RagB/SusD family nutrient uptake outer membrane protein [Parabacteroides sp. OttesenSCG-928-J18]
MKQIKYFTLALLLAGSLAGCDDFLTVQSPDELTSDSFWRDKEDAEAGLAAAYSKLEASTDTWEFPEVYFPVESYREDIIKPGSDAYNYPNWIELANFTYTNGNSQFTAYWRDNYYGINYSNQIIENVPNIPQGQITEEDRAMIQNEGYFLRGYYHMKLLLNWEQIVLRDKYISSTDELDKPLASRAETWDFIIENFTKATALPAERTTETQGRATRGAAYAFLGWAHLTRAYEESANKESHLNAAITALNQVTGYELVKELRSLFDGTNKNSKEGIFELQLTLNTANGARYRTQLHRFIGCGELWGWEEILPTDILVAEYKKEGKIATTGRYDSRLYETLFIKDEYFNDPEAGNVYGYTYDEWFEGADKPAFRKYMPADYAGMYANYFAPNIILMRYTNVLLMKAEALNELGRTSEAIPLINQVRARADMPAMTGTSQADVRAQIEHERMLEFPLENMRFYDLRRWGKVREALAAAGRTGFDPAKNNFYPVPIQEVNTNNEVN